MTGNRRKNRRFESYPESYQSYPRKLPRFPRIYGIILYGNFGNQAFYGDIENRGYRERYITPDTPNARKYRETGSKLREVFYGKRKGNGGLCSLFVGTAMTARPLEGASGAIVSGYAKVGVTLPAGAPRRDPVGHSRDTDVIAALGSVRRSPG